MVASMISLLLFSAPLPKFSVKFVDLERFEMSRNNEVTDARWDLSICGYTYTAMVDVIPAMPLAVLRGHPLGMRRRDKEHPDAEYWVYSFVAPDAVSALVGDYPSFDRPGLFVTAQASGQSWKTVRKLGHLPEPRGKRLTFGEPVSLNKVPAWATKFVQEASPRGFEQRVNVQKSRGGKTYQLVNLTYYPITPGYDACMFDAEETEAFVALQHTCVPLSSCVKGYGKCDFGEIVWASPNGWFVTRATRNGHDGFAWLYPK